VIKFSNIATLPQTNNERRGISAYALLEREIIPSAFKENPKNSKENPKNSKENPKNSSQ